MEDLISREAALKALEETNIRVKGMRFGKTILAEYSKQIRDGYIDIIRDIPAADANITRYGEWITIGKNDKGTIIRKCSCCGKQRKGFAKTQYCPDCGAVMLRTNIYISGQEYFEI